MVYCTLFDSNYLDKGVVMLKSLIEHDSMMKIYVLCMDDKCGAILQDLTFNNTILISLKNFEDKELISVKKKRSRGEYCWTCTAKLIKYVLTYYCEDECTYIDSDLYFYSNPSILIDEMRKANCCVQAISHRFPNTVKGRILASKNGKNCVQFNTFTTDKRSMDLLERWITQCINECSVDNSGDQKYTDSWGGISYVNISENGGAGVAPWNIHRYKLLDEKSLLLYDKYEKKRCTLIFYHFQNVSILDNDHARIMPKVENWCIDDDLYHLVYCDYLRKIVATRSMLLEKFNHSLPYSSTYIADVKSKNLIDYIRHIFSMTFSEAIVNISDTLLYHLKVRETIININEF